MVVTSQRTASHGGSWRRKLDWTILTCVLFLMEDLQGAFAKTVFFNSYGHCTKEYFPLDDDVYTARAIGDVSMHETLQCELTFRAPLDTGICVSLREVSIEDCGVTLAVYQQSSASGTQWKKFTCDNYGPVEMCTPERYVTIKLEKRKLNKNNGYNFEITVQKSSNLSGEDVILASSIGLFVGIIAGVVALIVVLAAIVLYCCCKPCKSAQLTHRGGKGKADTNSATQPPAVPSAPPAAEVGLHEDEHTPLQYGAGAPPLYPQLPPQPYPGGYGVPDEQPPPYAPPPYEEHAFPTKV
ncbi:uncharacterized protein [Littorina saxatilis]|uniref:Uncharacterized protein n=1 Tax=Littorina saxatilis TaxID=31220 RepID=A0AAN9BCH0_9CAEN